MTICVVGLWHLGCVTAACLASIGFDVVGVDPDAGLVEELCHARPPIREPRLDELIRQGLDRGHLSFSQDATAISQAGTIWVTFDTPIREDDTADVESVIVQIERLMPMISSGTLVLISSQVPVGTTRRLEERFRELRPGVDVAFAYSPENLRLGSAVTSFLDPTRVVIGADSDAVRDRLRALFASMTDRVVVMGIESAELSKHAINAFLAMSIAFANEVAVLAEHVGADARDVERALRTEPRIGSGAYVTAGSAFAGGTLARDVGFLSGFGRAYATPTHLIDGVLASNSAHAKWALHVLESELGALDGRQITVLGLTYKVGSDTLRRSAGVELCRDLVAAGARVVAHDPMAAALPNDLSVVVRADQLDDALRGSSGIVVSTPWPEYRLIATDTLHPSMVDQLVVVDATGFLEETLRAGPAVRYRAVGRAVR